MPLRPLPRRHPQLPARATCQCQRSLAVSRAGREPGGTARKLTDRALDARNRQSYSYAKCPCRTVLSNRARIMRTPALVHTRRRHHARRMGALPVAPHRGRTADLKRHTGSARRAARELSRLRFELAAFQLRGALDGRSGSIKQSSKVMTNTGGAKGEIPGSPTE
jgi:hypothetical protein